MTLRQRLRAFLEDTAGAAAAEFAIWLIFLVPAFLNIIDLGAYVFQRMQVQNAAQMAAQAAWATCESPPTSGCPNLANAVANAIASTSLGNTVTQSGSLVEGYYCPDTTTNVLTSNGSDTCSSGAKAGYYVQIAVTYPYDPIFDGVTVGQLLTTPITQTAWSRLK